MDTGPLAFKETLADLWNAREELEFSAMGVFAAVVNEFANGDITRRSWGAVLGAKSLLDVLQIDLSRAFSYLILCALDLCPATELAQIVTASAYRGHEDMMSDDVKELLLMPIADQLLSEILDICSSDCQRLFSMERRALTRDEDEVEDYWLRLEPDGIEDEPDERKYLFLERTDAPCNVGFPVDADNGCPLMRIKPSAKNVGDLLAIVKRVAAFRKAQAAEKRTGRASG